MTGSRKGQASSCDSISIRMILGDGGRVRGSPPGTRPQRPPASPRPHSLAEGQVAGLAPQRCAPPLGGGQPLARVTGYGQPLAAARGRPAPRALLLREVPREETPPFPLLASPGRDGVPVLPCLRGRDGGHRWSPGPPQALVGEGLPRDLPGRCRRSRTSHPRAPPSSWAGGSRGGSRGHSRHTAADVRRRPRAGTPGRSVGSGAQPRRHGGPHHPGVPSPGGRLWPSHPVARRSVGSHHSVDRLLPGDGLLQLVDAEGDLGCAAAPLQRLPPRPDPGRDLVGSAVGRRCSAEATGVPAARAGRCGAHISVGPRLSSSGLLSTAFSTTTSCRGQSGSFK